jgi:glycosyltransferase involved in cell wall biosynthesis
MSCENKVLSTRKPEIQEIIQEGINGFMVVNNSEEEIYNKIILALSSKFVGKNARETIKNKYNLDTLSRKQLRIIKNRLKL